MILGCSGKVCELSGGAEEVPLLLLAAALLAACDASGELAIEDVADDVDDEDATLDDVVELGFSLELGPFVTDEGSCVEEGCGCAEDVADGDCEAFEDPSVGNPWEELSCRAARCLFSLLTYPEDALRARLNPSRTYVRRMSIFKIFHFLLDE